MVKLKHKEKYISQTIIFDNLKNDFDTKINNETTLLNVIFNFLDQKVSHLQISNLQKENKNEKEKNIILNLSNFNNVKKLVITNKFSHFNKNFKPILLSVISTSITKLVIISNIANPITYIQNIPSALICLTCSNNNIKTIDYLPQSLKLLDFSNCNLDINKIALNMPKPTNLDILKINSNTSHFEIEKVIPLLSENLKIFECKDNQLSKLASIFNFVPNLEILKCSSNILSDSTFINLPSKLLILNCSKNLIVSLNNLPTQLEILDCSYNKIKCLDYLPSSIIKLNCSYNPIIQLDNLPNSLKHLIVISNPITQLENLPLGITNLKIACCKNFNNKISNPPTMLEKVIIINNKKTFLDNNFVNLINLPKIKSLVVNRHFSCESHLNKHNTYNLIK